MQVISPIHLHSLLLTCVAWILSIHQLYDKYY